VLEFKSPMELLSFFFTSWLICESLQGPQKVKIGSSNNVVTAKDIIIATGSVPFVPRGIEVDGTPYTMYFFLFLSMALLLYLFGL
jgi:hypothetical protein